MAKLCHDAWCDNLDQVKKQIDAATICPECDNNDQRFDTLLPQFYCRIIA